MKSPKRRGSHSAPPGEHTGAIVLQALSKRRPRKHVVYFGCIALAIILLAAAAMVIRTASDRKQYKQYMGYAQECYARQEYDSALTSLRKAAAIERTESCVLLMADCYQQQGKLDKALETLRTANTKLKGISAKISELERERDEQRDAEKVAVAGKMYPMNTDTLVLDNLGLGNGVLDEAAQLYALSSLSLENNKISDISALASLGGLSTLNLSGNKIRDISPLTQLPSLRTLYLDSNPIENLEAVCNMTSLTSLSIKGIDVDAETIDRISKALPNCAIHSEVAKEQVQDITIGGVTFKSDVTELSLSGMGLRDISALSSCTEIIKLDLSGNEISDLSPLMNMPSLEWLDVSQNALVDLKTLMGIESLRCLNASENGITSTSPLSMMSTLQELHLDSNPIREFSGIRKLRNVQKLGLSDTGLHDEDLDYIADLTQLTALNISDNPEVSGEAIEQLQAKITPCNITHSELFYSVDFGGTLFRSNEKELDVSGTGLADIGAIQRMTQLVNVNLSNNDISNIYPIEYSNSRLTIETLNLSNNAIEDITALACLQSVTELNLSGNNISSVLALMRLDKLKFLDLRGNNISESQIKDLRFALQKCEILTDYD